MAEQKSAYQRYPDYRVDLAVSDERIRARFGDSIVAESDRALIVHETDHDPVVYFPLSDVALHYFTATKHHTFCPFKGQASYWTLSVGAEVAENVMWSYPDPLPEVAGLKGHAAFYTDRVVITRVS